MVLHLVLAGGSGEGSPQLQHELIIPQWKTSESPVREKASLFSPDVDARHPQEEPENKAVDGTLSLFSNIRVVVSLNSQRWGLRVPTYGRFTCGLEMQLTFARSLPVDQCRSDVLEPHPLKAELRVMAEGRELILDLEKNE
ncbi:hypothetical protein P7K49_003904 [Saguinus oedipus]|uniref:Uncharacterized protein n=1 Tax=Saguinus oedipus TaxID=9490 RepID=A0ABQ9W5V2_SAGOE|nr:hypothetical protein P7K49_003904 [Saguinus oedipus]